MAFQRAILSFSLLLPASLMTAFASDAPTGGTQLPNGGAEVQRRTGPPPRVGPAFEVEVLTVDASDPTGVAAWAHLAAEGFRVVAAIPQADGKAVLLVERMMVPRAEGPRLPLILADHPALAADLLRQIQTTQHQRPRPVARPPAVTPSVPLSD